LGVVEKLLSLITFFAAAKKVIPPPGRRLLNKQQENRSALHEKKREEKKPAQAQLEETRRSLDSNPLPQTQNLIRPIPQFLIKALQFSLKTQNLQINLRTPE
jgi:hypothetical protein